MCNCLRKYMRKIRAQHRICIISKQDPIKIWLFFYVAFNYLCVIEKLLWWIRFRLVSIRHCEFWASSISVMSMKPCWKLELKSIIESRDIDVKTARACERTCNNVKTIGNLPNCHWFLPLHKSLSFLIQHRRTKNQPKITNCGLSNSQILWNIINNVFQQRHLCVTMLFSLPRNRILLMTSHDTPWWFSVTHEDRRFGRHYKIDLLWIIHIL